MSGSSVAAEAAARFADAVPKQWAATSFDRHGNDLAAIGRVADAAGWVARAHPLHLQLPHGGLRGPLRPVTFASLLVSTNAHSTPCGRG